MQFILFAVNSNLNQAAFLGKKHSACPFAKQRDFVLVQITKMNFWQISEASHSGDDCKCGGRLRWSWESLRGLAGPAMLGDSDKIHLVIFILLEPV